jgi:4-amino-4-deoxy-L-arabinose transferase-like glycosyltransferase
MAMNPIYPHKNVTYAGLALVSGLIICFHVLRLENVPKGFYCDELSIAVNSACIAKNGADEHGRAFPLFFEAFGEYKSPVYIYTLAAVYRAFGVSEWAVRLPSLLFYLVFMLGLSLAALRIFKSSPAVLFYLVLSAGFLPWFFTVSRIAFEPSVELAFFSFALYFIYRTFENENEKGLAAPLLAGLLSGLSFYSYSASRMLSLLMMVSVFIVYLRKSNMRKTGVMLSVFVITLIPAMIFYFRDPGALLARYQAISYLQDGSLGMFSKVFRFTAQYLGTFSPSYLIFSGDGNLRHATGFGGELLLACVLLFPAGMARLIIKGSFRKNPFLLFMLIFLVLSPVPAALTTNANVAVRNVLTGYLMLFFSGFGIISIMELRNKSAVNSLLSAVFILVAVQSGLYLNDYFSRYEKTSIPWFLGYDFKNTLKKAVELGPDEIVVSKYANNPYIYLKFYGELVDTKGIPVRVGEPEGKHNTCIIYFEWNNELMKGLKWKDQADMALEGSVVRLRYCR